MANPRMEGTHRPMNRPASLSPLNHSTSENTRERNAASNINRSVIVNFLSIVFFLNLNKYTTNLSSAILFKAMRRANGIVTHISDACYIYPNQHIVRHIL